MNDVLKDMKEAIKNPDNRKKVGYSKEDINLRKLLLTPFIGNYFI